MTSGHKNEYKNGIPSIFERLKHLFEKEAVPYRAIHDREVYAASELTGSIHSSGRDVVKVVIIRAFGQDFMAVLPSHRQLDLIRFSEVIGRKQVSLQDEKTMRKHFPDCEAGAMPPFGGFYGIPVYCDSSLAHEPVIFFQAGNHRMVIEMRYQDYFRIVRPTVCHFTLEAFREVSGF